MEDAKMEKKNFRNLLSWLFIAIFALGIILPVAPAARAENPPIPGVSGYWPDSTIVYLDAPTDDYSLYFSGISLKDITGLKSSNKKVATVKKLVSKYNSESVCIRIIPKKVGKTNVSFKIKHDNKTYAIKTIIAVKKYINPFKSIKIGTLNIGKYLDSARHTEAINAHVPLKKTLSKKKLNFTLKPGWILQDASLRHAGKWTDLKSGQKITVKKGDEIDFEIKDPKGDNIWFYFFFD